MVSRSHGRTVMCPSNVLKLLRFLLLFSVNIVFFHCLDRGSSISLSHRNESAAITGSHRRLALDVAKIISC